MTMIVSPISCLALGGYDNDHDYYDNDCDDDDNDYYDNCSDDDDHDYYDNDSDNDGHGDFL